MCSRLHNYGRLGGVYLIREGVPMPVPMFRAAEEQTRPADESEPIKCALVARPKHPNEFFRYLLVIVAWLAVGLLIAIALYYTLLASA
jgi:hypothetical protein